MVYAKRAGYDILATQDEQEPRIKTCVVCDDHDPLLSQCNLCSCFIYAKTQITIEECPRKKWLAIWRKKGLTKPLKD